MCLTGNVEKSSFLCIFFTEADRKHLISAGEITFTCENLIKNQQRCINTTWAFVNNPSSTVELVTLGQIQSHKPGRLSLSENCSLTVKNLTDEDAGFYICQQFNSSGVQISQDAAVDLSVVTSEYLHHMLSSPPLNHDDHFSDDLNVTVVFLSHLHLHQ